MDGFSRKIMVDSRFRKGGVPGSFTYELARAITLPTMCAGFVNDVEMLHSCYNINTHSRFFYFFEYLIDHTTSPVSYRQRNHRVELATRNYDAASLLTELQTKINAVLTNGVREINITYDANTGKYTFAWSNTGTASFVNAADQWAREFGGSSVHHTMTQSGNQLTFNIGTLDVESYNGGPAFFFGI